MTERSPRPDRLPFHTFGRIATARRGVVATSHPLAAGAGLEALKAGGNAMDAALAAAAVLTVVQPQMSHLGGDLFVVLHSAAEGRAYALNGSGRAPREAIPERFAAGIPERGPLAVTVPGAVHGWCEVNRRWGRSPLADCLRPAIELARDGFPIGPRLSAHLAERRDLLGRFPASCAQYLGGATDTGAMLRQPDLARTLEAVAADGVAGFYEGEIARELVRGVRELGGLLSESDLREHTTAVLEPLAIEYRGVRVLGQPPPSQGHILLQELKLAEQVDLRSLGLLTAPGTHVLIEAKKRAFADRRRYLGDPDHTDVPLGWLLSDTYARARAATIDPARADPQPVAGDRPLPGGDTTYLAAADAEGNAVSWIQSVFAHFGSGVVAGRTGVLLNNRMNGFTPEPGHPNALAPGKRPAHTLNAYILERDGRPWIVGGTPGADYQVQTNLQIITHLVDHGLDVAEANDAPWWASESGVSVIAEDRFPAGTLEGLAERGHVVSRLGAWSGGRTVQLVEFRGDGALLASSDVRAEGHAAVW